MMILLFSIYFHNLSYKNQYTNEFQNIFFHGFKKAKNSYQNANIINNTRKESNLNSMYFDCLIENGDITIFLNCSTCKLVQNYIWFKVFFENGEKVKIEYDDRYIYGTNKISNFVDSNKIIYSKSDNRLDYNTGSMYIYYMENTANANLQCLLPTETPKPTMTPFATTVINFATIYATSTAGKYENLIYFDCPIYKGDITIYSQCSTCKIRDYLWFKVFFENKKIINVEYLQEAIYNDLTLEQFVPKSTILYNEEMNYLSFELRSNNMNYMKNTANISLQCIPSPTSTPTPSFSPSQSPTPSVTPITINGSVSEIIFNNKDYYVYFDCPIKKGFVKIFLSCSSCSIKERIWFSVFFENGKISKMESDDRIIYGGQYQIGYFLQHISYIQENNALKFTADSGSIRCMDELTEFNLQCFLPTKSPSFSPSISPTPSISEFVENGEISDIKKNGNNYEMRFDCPIYKGNIKINLNCSTCIIEEFIWFDVFFENNQIVNVEYDNRIVFLDNNEYYKITFFVNNVIYTSETNTLKFNTGSKAILMMENDAVSLLECIQATKTPSLTAVPSLSPTLSPIISSAQILKTESNENNYYIYFVCPIARGYIKIFLSCTTCLVKNNIWFNVIFENNNINKIEYDNRFLNEPNHDLSFYLNNVNYDSRQRLFSFNTGLNNLKYVEDKTLVDLECAPTETPLFSESNKFTMSNDFSESAIFTTSNAFSDSSKFTISKAFSESGKFSMSNDFSDSVKFTISIFFSESGKFSTSNLFSKSTEFTTSIIFSHSAEFTTSNIFSESIKFTISNEFSKSEKFSTSNAFSESEKFTTSNTFSKTTKFTSSNDFSQSTKFTLSNVFPVSLNFTTSNIFSDSSKFTTSKAFSESYIFTTSIIFSESNKFSASNAFTGSNKFSSKAFSKSIVFTRSNVFSESIKFSISNVFSKFMITSDEFTHLNQFTESDNFQSTLIFIPKGNDKLNKNKKKIGMVAGVVAGVVCSVIAIVIVFVLMIPKMRKNVNDSQSMDASIDSMMTFTDYVKESNPLYDDDVHESKDPFLNDFDE